MSPKLITKIGTKLGYVEVEIVRNIPSFKMYQLQMKVNKYLEIYDVFVIILAILLLAALKHIKTIF